MEAELMCGVCLEYFDKPLMLPCTHNFCRKCIEGILSVNSRQQAFGLPRQRPKYHLDCPLCQRSIDLEQGIESLTQNRILENIIELHRKNEPLASNDTAWKLDSLTTDSQCLMHNSEPMALYCLTCNRAVCIYCDCVANKSSGASHKCVPIKEQSEQYQLKISNAISEVKRKVIPINDDIQLLEDMVEQIKTNEDSIKSQLESQMTGLIQSLKTQHEELLRQLSNDMKAIKRPIDESLKKHLQLKRTIDDHLKRLNSIKTTRDTSLRIKLMKESERQLNSLLCFDMVMFSTKDMPTVDMPVWDVETDQVLQSIKQLSWRKTGGTLPEYVSSSESSKETSRQNSREEDTAVLAFDLLPSDTTMARPTMKKHKPKKYERRASDLDFSRPVNFLTSNTQPYSTQATSNNPLLSRTLIKAKTFGPDSTSTSSSQFGEARPISSNIISSASIQMSKPPAVSISTTSSVSRGARAASVPPSMPCHNPIAKPAVTSSGSSWFSSTVVASTPRSEQRLITKTTQLSPETVRRLQARADQQSSNAVSLGQSSLPLGRSSSSTSLLMGAVGGADGDAQSDSNASKVNFPIPKTSDFIPQSQAAEPSDNTQNKGLTRKPKSEYGNKNEVNKATLMAMVTDQGDIGLDTVIKSMETVRLGVKDNGEGSNNPHPVSSNPRMDRRFSTGNANLPTQSSWSMQASNLPTISARDFSPAPNQRSSSPNSSTRRTLRPKKKLMKS